MWQENIVGAVNLSKIDVAIKFLDGEIVLQQGNKGGVFFLLKCQNSRNTISGFVIFLQNNKTNTGLFCLIFVDWKFDFEKLIESH